MNTRIYNIRLILLAVFMVFFNINEDLHGQTSHASCNLVKIGNTEFPVNVNLYGLDGKPITSIKSGLDFNLSITLPGGVCGSGEDSPLYSIQIVTSDNLGLGIIPAGLHQFSQTGYQRPYINTTEIRSDKGRAINVPFHFLAGSTCNDEVGSFSVYVRLPCGNVTYYCYLKVDLKAEAKSYWEVKKKHYWGNLRGGVVVWEIRIENTNPTPGIGDLNIIDGNITDHVFPGTIISVEPLSLFPDTPSITWKITNTILSTTQPVVYYVWTYSCEPAGTLVRNCVDYEFCLGKRYSPVIEKKPDTIPPVTPIPPVFGMISGEIGDSTKTGQNMVDQTGIIDIPTVCCENISSSSCDTVRLVAGPAYNTNFGKSLTYASNLNYAQGCEGEYSIVVSNSGNVPLTNLWLMDYYMAYKDGVMDGSYGINVTRITIVGYGGVNMDYVTNLGSIGSPDPGTNSPPYNFSQSKEWYFPEDFPTALELKTISGKLEGGYIVIRIRFTITAEAGIIVRNFADLVYNGTFKEWGNWCSLPLPPDTLIKTKHDTVDFKVKESHSVPGLAKCIPSGQQSYMINDEIDFRIVVSNHGQGNLSGTLTDLLSSPQDLDLVPNSVTYSWGSASFNPYTTTPACIDGKSLASYGSTSPPGWLTSTLQPQNLSWNLNNMPGCCELDTAYYLVIEFKAKVKPQLFGNYENEAILISPTGRFPSAAPYNVMREDIIEVTKLASPQHAEPGQQFEYTIVVKNGGTIELGNIEVKDQLPACVMLNTKSAKGPGGQNITNIQYDDNSHMYSFPGIFIKPEEKIELVLKVTRTATGQNPCCNDLATGYGVPFIKGKGQGFTIQDSDGPVCVESGLCCDMEFVNVALQSDIKSTGKLVLTFTVSAGVKPIIEADIDLLDYHIKYNPVACKPLSIGNLTGHIRPVSTSSIGGILKLTPPGNPPAVNNAISWAAPAGSSLMFNNQVIQIYFVRPAMLNIWCCDGTVYYCFKVRLKDVDCNVCEKIVCGSATLSDPKTTNTNSEWVSPAAKDAYILESLENAVPDYNLQQKDSIPDFNKLK